MLTQPPIPRLAGRPLLGNLLEFRENRLRLLTRLIPECGDAAEMRFGPVPVLALGSSELAEALLVDHAGDFVKSRGLALARVLVGDGMLTSERDVHRRQRKLIAPGFRHARIAGYADAMVELAEEAHAGWRDGSVVNVAGEMMRLTLAIVARTLFGARVDAEAEEIGEALTVALRWVVDAVSRPVNPPLWVPIRRNREMSRAIARLDETVYRLIRARRRSREDRGDVLSMLLAAQDEDDGTRMTDAQVRDEVMTLFLAGHETTANALSWTWLLLAKHPEVYARMREEVDSVLGGRPPAQSDLANLPFTLQVLKEAMRLYPPAYIVGRQAVRDVYLRGLRVPKGRIVLVNIYGIQRRAEYFPEPERFLPERFSPERERALPRFAYLPFGGGSRICIGNHFALMEGHLVLAALARRVVFEVSHDDGNVEPEPLVTLRPKGGVWLRVRRRHGRRDALSA